MQEISLRKGGAFPHCAAAELQNTVLIRPLPGLIDRVFVQRYLLEPAHAQLSGDEPFEFHSERLMARPVQSLVRLRRPGNPPCFF
jgi:hypothetical protein